MTHKHYDHVIVGAGSAGCVLAARLSEDPGCRVLLLEAGGKDKGMNVRIPAAFTKLFKTGLDWDHSTAPQQALGGRELYWPRAKMLGGCSSMNAQCYVRGNAADYDLWEDLGNPGWAFADLLPYFLRAEGYVDGVAGLHGRDGPLRVESLRDPNPTTSAFLEAAAQSGIRRIEDVNGPSQDGVAHMRVNQRRGQRWSAADAYLRPAMGRPNLTVVTGVQATRIVLDGRRATAIEYLHHGRPERVSSGELVLAAGAVRSPQLLMLSGIGPAAELRAHGIDVACDLPGVGRNLEDHLAVAVIHACQEAVSLLGAESVGNLLRYLVLRRGMLTSNVAEACAFVRTRPALAAPDVELVFAPVPYVGHGLVPQKEHAITIGAVLLQPQSRGSVRLRSRDPLAAPQLLPEYLTDPGGEDLATLVRGVELAQRIFAAPGLRRYAGPRMSPASGEPLDAFVRARAETLYHPTGTCRMGIDDLAVVDPELRVRGIERLRIADASVMPRIVRGHTHAPTVMIGEKAADLLRGLVVAGRARRTTSAAETRKRAEAPAADVAARPG